MLKFLIPFILVLLIVIFWEKISNEIYKKFKLKLNNFLIAVIIIGVSIIIFLLNN
jgi:hypothetical protein